MRGDFESDEPKSMSHWGVHPTARSTVPVPRSPTPPPPDSADQTPALARQIGGGHYKTKGIQPIEYIMANDLTYCEGSAVKYITRWYDKGGVQDLRKAIHFLEMQIEDFEKTGERR